MVNLDLLLNHERLMMMPAKLLNDVYGFCHHWLLDSRLIYDRIYESLFEGQYLLYYSPLDFCRNLKLLVIRASIRELVSMMYWVFHHHISRRGRRVRLIDVISMLKDYCSKRVSWFLRLMNRWSDDSMIRWDERFDLEIDDCFSCRRLQ